MGKREREEEEKKSVRNTLMLDMSPCLPLVFRRSTFSSESAETEGEEEYVRADY